MSTFHDLLGREHEPLRCIGYVKLALARIFHDFSSAEIPSTRAEAEAFLRDHSASRWREIGTTPYDARREGDVIYGLDSEGEAYTAVLVDERAGGVLTSEPRRGCHLVPRRAITGVVSVQRRGA